MIHWICVPIIFLSIYGLIRAIPLNIDFGHSLLVLSPASILLLFSLFYYFTLSRSLFVGFLIWSIFVYSINEIIFQNFGALGLFIFSLVIFILAWIGQFIGHGIEGKKPSFLKDVQFLLIGPAWIMTFIYRKLRLKF